MLLGSGVSCKICKVKDSIKDRMKKQGHTIEFSLIYIDLDINLNCFLLLAVVFLTVWSENIDVICIYGNVVNLAK